MSEATPIAHLVWRQFRRAADDVEDYFEVARPGDKSVDGSDPFPVYDERAISDTAGRLYDAGASMADGGETRMTAAEEVLAYLLVEKIGAPDDVGYSPDQAKQMIEPRLNLLAAKDAEIAAIKVALDGLRKEAEGAYCQGLNQFSKTECLGWEAKVNTGVFGKAEYEAHKKANELIGRHHGMAHAVKTLRAALKEKADA